VNQILLYVSLNYTEVSVTWFFLEGGAFPTLSISVVQSCHWGSYVSIEQ